jgi:glycosyltransferase involved in cell wall biosynthesis
MRKSILLIGNHPPPFGGVPAHIKYLAPFLAAQGWNVHILNFTGNRPWGRVPPQHIEGYTVHRPTTLLLWIHLLLPGRYLLALRRIGGMALRHPKLALRTLGMANVARRIIAKQGVGVISAYHVQAGLAGSIAGEPLSLPLVTTVFGELFSEAGLFRDIRKQVLYLCSMSRKILSCSLHCADSFRSIGMDYKAEAVHYGIDVGAFHPGNEAARIRERLGIGPDEIVIGYIGRMVEEMGLHVLLGSVPLVLARNPGVRFLVAGRKGGLLPMALELRSAHPANLFIMTDVSFEDLPFCYAAASIVVVPSINERACLGLAIEEGLASGKPVIVSNVGGGPEVVDPETGVLVPPADPQALAEAILGLAADPGRMDRMGCIGREKMINLFDKNVTNARMEGIFLETLNPPR